MTCEQCNWWVRRAGLWAQKIFCSIIYLITNHHELLSLITNDANYITLMKKSFDCSLHKLRVRKYGRTNISLIFIPMEEKIEDGGGKIGTVVMLSVTFQSLSHSQREQNRARIYLEKNVSLIVKCGWMTLTIEANAKCCQPKLLIFSSFTDGIKQFWLAK